MPNSKSEHGLYNRFIWSYQRFLHSQFANCSDFTNANAAKEKGWNMCFIHDWISVRSTFSIKDRHSWFWYRACISSIVCLYSRVRVIISDDKTWNTALTSSMVYRFRSRSLNSAMVNLHAEWLNWPSASYAAVCLSRFQFFESRTELFSRLPIRGQSYHFETPFIVWKTDP